MFKNTIESSDLTFLKSITLNLKLFITGAVIASTFSLAGCSGSNESDTKHKAESETTQSPVGTYKVLTDADGMPFTFRNEMGDPTGFDIELMDAIAANQGFIVEYEIVPWGLLMPSMTEEKADLAIGHISITDEREKVFNFSAPYFESAQLALVQPELADAQSFDELADKKIQVQANTIFADLLDNKGIEYTTDPNIFPIISNLVNDNIDATIGDSGILMYYQHQYPEKNFAIIEDKTVTPDAYGIIVKSGSEDLLTKVNAGLYNLKQSGEYQKIYHKWFE